jgi:hypothetical protein
MEEVRFKTEEEFIKEFGNEWQKSIKQGWVSNMNELFGKPLSDFTTNDNIIILCTNIKKERTIHINMRPTGRSFSVSIDMIHLPSLKNLKYSFKIDLNPVNGWG